MADAVFELKDIQFSYLGRYPALRGVTMNINKGEKIAVIGANGSGKSTLLHVLDGLISPDYGTIKAFGRKLDGCALNDKGFNRDFRSRVGLLFQNSDIQLFCPTVKEDIVFAPLNFGFETEKIQESFNRVCNILNIEDLAARSPHRLSVGEKRKVALASILIFSPEVLILDEPTAGLDPRTARELIDLLIEYHEEGKTVITATHDLHILGEIADTVYVFGQDKRIIRVGSAGEILEDDDFLSSNNLIHIHRHRHQSRVRTHPHRHLDHHPG